MTEFRDRWLRSKQVTPELAQQLAQLTRAAVQQVEAGMETLATANRGALDASAFPDLYAAVETMTEASRYIAQIAHNLKFLCDFQVPPATLYGDHFISQHFLMSAFKRTWWVEGCCFCGLGIEPGARLLDLGCGTGYYTDVFFSPFASEIVAIDVDPRAIETARRFHQAQNIRYEVCDFRDGLPDGPFDAVVWTPTIHAYSVADVDRLMTRVRAALAPGGRLLGFTAIETTASGDDVLWHDLDSLGARLRGYFANVRVFERTHVTIEPPRTNLYFLAGDGVLPFDDAWPHGRRLQGPR